MAGIDYLRCENCGAKAIYDADWFHRVAEGQAVAALCETCSKTHWLKVEKKWQNQAEEES